MSNKELHEVDLKSYRDSVIRVDSDYRIDSELELKRKFYKYEEKNRKFYHYAVTIYDSRMNIPKPKHGDCCDICGKDFRIPMNQEDFSWFMDDRGRSVCKECAKPLVIELRIEESRNHGHGCTCHSCQVAYEMGYFKNKVGNDWVRRPTVICKSAKEDCKCYHANAHIENDHCNDACFKNRLVGCELV